MALWGGGGNGANDVPKFAADLVSAGSGNANKKTKSRAMYQNTTPNAYVNKQTVGMYYFTDADIRSMNPKPGGTAGWYLKKNGSGNRSNRVQWECVAALGTPTGPRLRFIATRTRPPNNFFATNKQVMNRSRHLAVNAITSMALLLPNFYVNTTTHVETASGASMTATATLEYPSGTILGRFTFGGQNSGTISSGTYAVTDLMTGFSIPAGAYFFIRWWYNNSAGIVYGDATNSSDTTNGECMAFGVTTTDLTGSGGSFTNAGNFCTPPLGIIGLSANKAVAILGDSRAIGLNDAWSTSGGQQTLIGDVERGLGQFYPTSILATKSNTAALYLSGCPLQIAIAQTYSTHIVCELGVNDLFGGATAAATVATIQSLRALFSQKFIQTTCSPYNNSSDSWATLVNQSGNISTLPAFNDLVRAGISGVNGFIDIASITESSLNSGKWIVNGTANYATSDGKHESQAANLLVASGLPWQAAIN